MTRPLISEAMGVTLTLLWLGESPKSVGAEFGSEGVETEGVSGLPLEEVEVSEQPLEGVLGEGSEWKVCSSIGDCWKGLRIGSTLMCVWNLEVVRVQRMPKVSEVGVGKTLRCFRSGKQVVP